MQHEFKPGDNVECIDNYGAPTDFTVGNTYTVTDVEDREDGPMAILHAIGDRGRRGGMYAKRFKLAAPEFKVGDKVTPKTNIGEFFTVGKTYEIVRVSPSGMFTMTDDKRPHPVDANHSTDAAWLTANFNVVPATLDVQVGKTYRARNGDKIGPMEAPRIGDWIHLITHQFDGKGWYAGGRYSLFDSDPLDLIAEWPLTVEVGKTYLTADGERVGPMRVSARAFGYPGGGRLWRADGLRYFAYDRGKGADIVAEAPEPAPEPAKTATLGDILATAIASNDNGASKFKVGDRVRFHAGYGGRAAGKEATVIVVSSYGVQVDRGGRWGVSTESPRNLELVTVAKPHSAIVAIIENGVPRPNPRPYVHDNRESAATEAARLAGIKPGSDFGVYELVGTHRAEKPKSTPTYKHEWQTHAARGHKINAIKELRSMTGIGLKSAKDAVEDWLERNGPTIDAKFAA